MDGYKRTGAASDFRTEGRSVGQTSSTLDLSKSSAQGSDLQLASAIGGTGAAFRTSGAPGESVFSAAGNLRAGGGGDVRRLSADSAAQAGRSRGKAFVLPKPKTKISRNQIKLRDYQIEELGKAFDIFDETGGGKMNVKDIKTVIRACGFEPTKDEIKTIMKECDPNNRGFLTKEDFIKLFMIKLAQKDPREEIERAFKFFDKSNNGFITFHDLKLCAQEIGEDLHDEEIQEMMDEADVNDDGTVDLEEFIKMMSKTYYFD